MTVIVTSPLIHRYCGGNVLETKNQLKIKYRNTIKILHNAVSVIRLKGSLRKLKDAIEHLSTQEGRRTKERLRDGDGTVTE
jgi:hypothetical protein